MGHRCDQPVGISSLHSLERHQEGVHISRYPIHQWEAQAATEGNPYRGLLIGAGWIVVNAKRRCAVAISLLMGNGINQLSNPNASWKHLIQSLASIAPADLNLSYADIKPPTLVYEEILLARPSLKPVNDDHRLKSQIADLVSRFESNDVHRRVMRAPIRHVLTTNYDYGFELSTGQKNKRDNLEVESKFSVYRRRAVADRFVWHLHGEAGAPNTITLGYDQ